MPWVWVDDTNIEMGGAVAPLYNGTTTTTSRNTSPRWYRSMLADQLVSQTATTSGLSQWMPLGTATTASASTYNTVWWIDEQVEHAQYIALAQQRAVRTRQRTEEERRRDEDIRARYQQEQLRLAQERAAAIARSKELLLKHLTADQRAMFEREKFFIVEGGRSKQLYRIRDRGSYSANIEVLAGKPGKVTHRLCCHLADGRVPLYDHLLAQKVWIEHDEDAFLRQANVHHISA